MPKKILTKSNLLFLGALVLFAYLMYTWRGQIETITPGQELRAECVIDTACPADFTCEQGHCVSIYPKEGLCDGKVVTVWGRPSFYTDPAMAHMTDAPCSNTDQCRHWPPEGAPTNVECCMNTGVCIG